MSDRTPAPTRLKIETRPIPGQTPGTSGLRRKTREFMAPKYLETYVQSIFDGIGGIAGKTLVVGGDGRFWNRDAIQLILRMMEANGAARAIVGAGGILSTPAASHLIRLRGADGGLILSASHNPGGEAEDFGLKFNGPNGGPAAEAVTDEIVRMAADIREFAITDMPDVDIGAIGAKAAGGLTVEVVDPVADYLALMESLFDFDAIAAMRAGGFAMRFDAMNAVTGPYARAIFEDRLGFAPGTVMHATPLPDFGGLHPDPNPTWAHELMALMMSDGAPDFGAASDGDGDRNMIVGRAAYVTPSDSLALLAAHAARAPGYANGLAGVARSMPTSRAVDRVAAARDLPCYETPTGWKFFGNLLDAGRITLCGEESAGTGSDHVREKDGIWAVLLWLNILASTGKSVAELLSDHWAEFGRDHYTRHDYEGVDAAAAADLMTDLRGRLDSLVGTQAGGLTVEAADEFGYHDPVDGSTSARQGIRVHLSGDARVVYRLSGTGTSGATLRVYMERRTTDPDRLGDDPQAALRDVVAAARELAGIEARTGRPAPDVVT
ncbi:MAG: alpha-D-glucose phosphate-specific phosphoglucomutase [Paracoccaceae bacterium]